MPTPYVQIDQLIATKNGTLFTVSGYLNNDLGAASVIYSTLVSADKMLLLKTDDNRSNKMIFTKDINFNSYGKRDYLCITLTDDTAGQELNVEVAGIVVKDTDYPPPARIKTFIELEFTEEQLAALNDIVVEKIELNRIPAYPKYFSIKVDLSCSTTHYVAVDYQIVVNPMYNSEVLVLQVAESAAATNPIKFPLNGDPALVADLEEYIDRGLPVVVTLFDINEDLDWGYIDKKKGLLFIDTPEIDRI